MTCKAFLSYFYFYIFVLLLFVVAAVEAEGWSLIIQSAAVGACITSHERCGTGVAPLLSLLICKPLSAATKQTVRKSHRLTLVARSCSTHKMLHRFIHSESDLVDVFCWTAGVPGRCTNARPVHVMTVHGRKGQKKSPRLRQPRMSAYRATPSQRPVAVETEPRNSPATWNDTHKKTRHT